MRIRTFATELNVVSEIDELIMQLTYVKNGKSAGVDKLKKGVELIEFILSFSEKSDKTKIEENLGYNTFHDKQQYYSGEYNVTEHKEELKKAKESIENFIESKVDSSETDIENIQKLLLKISIPIWKEEVSILKPSHFKRI